MKFIKILFTSFLAGIFINIIPSAAGNNYQIDRAENNKIFAQRDRTRRIQFPLGSSSAIVANSVVRGTRDIYLLRANPGQIMKVNLSSLENNAVFDLIAPNGTKILQETYIWQGILPGQRSGDYKIIVGGTRGNASYHLEVEIR